MIPAPMNTDSLVRLRLADERKTAQLARALAARAQAGDCLLLQGDLGAGKSCFARAFIRALAPASDEDIPSPTFTLVQLYEKDVAPLYHFDLYRLERPEETYELGLEEALDCGICLIEWPERLSCLRPAAALTVALEFADSASARRVALSGGADWAERLAGLEAELGHD